MFLLTMALTLFTSLGLNDAGRNVIIDLLDEDGYTILDINGNYYLKDDKIMYELKKEEILNNLQTACMKCDKCIYVYEKECKCGSSLKYKDPKTTKHKQLDRFINNIGNVLKIQHGCTDSKNNSIDQAILSSYIYHRNELANNKIGPKQKATKKKPDRTNFNSLRAEYNLYRIITDIASGVFAVKKHKLFRQYLRDNLDNIEEYSDFMDWYDSIKLNVGMNFWPEIEGVQGLVSNEEACEVINQFYDTIVKYS
jgi:hypothetical protein